MIVKYIEDITIDLVFENDLEESFVLPVPDSFEIDFLKDSLRSKFRDYNFILRPGKHKYKVLVNFGYETHRMEIKKLIGAKQITLRFPPDVENLQEFEAKLLNKSFLKDYFQGLVIGGVDNPIPSGSLQLEFELVGSFEWDEILEMKWYMDNNTSDQLPQTIVLLTPESMEETGLKPLFSWNSDVYSNNYQIQISKSSIFDVNIYDEVTSLTAFTPPDNLDVDDTYYFRVRGINDVGNGNWTSRQFLTGNYTYEVFTSSGTWDWSDAGSPSTIDVLVVAGGGGGGVYRGGGGGAGGCIYTEDFAVSGDINVVVGNGGQGGFYSGTLTDGQQGGNSSFDSIIAVGGGRGGNGNGTLASDRGGDGGSGGGSGGSNSIRPVGLGVAGQGNDGGVGIGASAAAQRGGGGGGGKGAVGVNTVSGVSAGDGGIGFDYSSIFGTDVGDSGWFAGGGGGATDTSSLVQGLGAQGGGGNGYADKDADHGIANTGGGGGGAGGGFTSTNKGGNGGSGVVIVRYI